MLKFLFFDNQDLEEISGFSRRLEPPAKRPSPLFRPRQPWETGYIGLYGSVLRRPDGRWQMWHWTRYKNPIDNHLGGLAYAESDDGIKWRTPPADLFRWRGKKMNVVFPSKTHGPSVIYDAADPRDDWRYKMVTGAPPSGAVSVFRSPDGINWRDAAENPVIPRDPSGPMSLHRRADGLYVLYLRPPGPARRIGRSESMDLKNWSDTKVVMDTGPEDEPQLRFFALSAAQYGNYEIGAVWTYNTLADDSDWNKQAGMHGVALAYTRSGSLWLRPAPSEDFIAHGGPQAWDRGNLQAASNPVFCDDEMRFYYVGTKVRDRVDWKRRATDCGLGLATVKPDRFVAMETESGGGEIVSRQFAIRSPEIFVNAKTERGGSLTLEILDAGFKPLAGFKSKPIIGDGVALPVAWSGRADASAVVMKPVRFRLKAKKARVYSIWMKDGEEKPVYWRFRGAGAGDPMAGVGK
jgi:hypothetical protein